MNKRSVAAVVGLSVAMAACASEQADPPSMMTETVIAENVVVADEGFAGDVRVLADRLLITTRGHEAVLAKLRAGAIVASRRSIAHPDQNPNGFLRHVDGISTEGGDTVIRTHLASLADAIVDADFDAELDLDDADDAAEGGLATRTVHPLGMPGKGGKTFDLPDVTVWQSGAAKAENAAGDVTATASASIKLVNNSLRVSAKPKVSWKFRGASFKKFHAELGVGYEATSTIELKGQASVTRTLADKDLSKVTLGRKFFMIGWLPVEVAVKAKVSVKCEVALSGKVDARTSFHAYGTPKLGVHYENGDWSNVGDPTDFTLEHDTTVNAESKSSVTCGMPVELEIMLYESAGPFASVAPTVEVSSKIKSTCTTPKDAFSIELHDELKLGAKVEILDHKLAEWAWSKSTPSILLYPTKAAGAAETCPEPNECTTDTSCGLTKACSWDGKKKCCRTPAPVGAKKCLADSECPTGTVCGWNLDAFVCQTPACN